MIATLQKNTRFNIHPLSEGYRCSDGIQKVLFTYECSWFLQELIAIAEDFREYPILSFELETWVRSQSGKLIVRDGTDRENSKVLLEESYSSFQPLIPDQRIVFFRTGLLFVTHQEFVKP